MTQYRSNRGRGRGGGNAHQGAKERSKNKFAAFDADILSNYDDVEDESLPIPRNKPRQERDRPGMGTRLTNAGRLRTDRVALLSAGGKNAEIVSKIKVPFGRRYGERWIIKQLNNQDIDNFKPILITTTPRGDVEFFLKDNDAAEAVKAISKRIIHQKTADRVLFVTSRCPAPWTRLSKADVDLINKAVDSRYQADNRAIDLSEFFLDPIFTANNAHMLLSKNNVMLAVIDRIDEKYGSITALSLKGNRLRHLDFAAMLVYIVKFVGVLDLSDNMIENFEQLKKLTGLPVKMLFFEGNPACEILTRSSDYLNAVQQVFPKVIKLDGQDVPAAANQNMNDDEDEPTNEIAPRPGFYANNDKIRQVVEDFVLAYISEYDGVNGATTRQQLVPAYDAMNSTFTLTIENLGDSEFVRYKNNDNYSNLIRASHNILQEAKWERYRSNRTFKGAIQIVAQLAKMPVTNHFKESFVVDVHLVTPTLLGFTLQGLFEEGPFAAGQDVPVLNYFSRSFYVSPRGEESVAVVSDMLYISAITTDRMARYKMLINKCISNGTAPANPMSGTIAPSQQQQQENQEPSDDIKRQMVEQFSQTSGMIAEWSTKCLVEFNWNYEKAGEAFMSMRSTIPPEAFAVRP